MDSADLSRVSQIEENNGYAVYTRNRRLRTRGERGILEKLEGYSIDFSNLGVNVGEGKMVELKEDSTVGVRSEGVRRFTRSVLKLHDESSEMENGDRKSLEGNLSNLGVNGGEGKAVEVKEDSTVGVRSEGARRFTRSVLKLHEESSEMENGDSRSLEGNLSNLGVNGGEGMTVKVRKDSMVGVRSEGARRFTRSVLKLNDKSSEMENGDSRSLEGNLSSLGVNGGEGKMVKVRKAAMVGVRSEGARRFTRSVLKLNDERSEMENGDIRSLETNLSSLGVNGGEGQTVEVKKDSVMGVRSEGARRFTRSVLKLNDESSEIENGDCRSLEGKLSNLGVNCMEDKMVKVRSKGARRFTRSVLKLNDESLEMENGDFRSLEGNLSNLGVNGMEDKMVKVRSKGARRLTRSVLKLNDESSEMENGDCRGLEGNSKDSTNLGLNGGEVKMVEMKEGSTVGVRSEGGRRFTRSMLKLNVESSEIENGDCRGLEGNSIELSNLGFNGGEGKMMEVKEDSMVGVRSEGVQRFTRSVHKFTNESLEMENGDHRGSREDAVVLKGDKSMVLDTPKRSKMERKIARKILIQGRPATAGKLLKTGLLEGYPVFYNGGKRGSLRGTVKDSGILCSCSLCKGAKVVRPARFELHALKSYNCAAQYICFENGKSLLDVVKECRRSSLMTLEEIIEKVAGPLPVKESVNCRNCGVAQVDLLCDSCMIIVNSEVDAECDKSRSLEPFSGITMSDNSEMQNTSQIKSRPGRKKRKHSELTLRSSEKSTSRLSSRRKGELKITNMLSNAASLPESSERGSPSASMQSKISTRITKKDYKMHRLVFENGGLPDGTELGYYSHGKKLRDGYKMGSGIICRCCNNLVSASQFEAHAGWASRRKPYMYIYTSNGVSLHEYAVSLLKGSKYSLRENDDLCSICADGGELVLCDGCPRAFHIDCASLSSIPDGKWFCTYCLNMFQRDTHVEMNDNAIAAGRVSGIDPLQQITDRCMRIVKNPEEAEVIACVLCRGVDFSKSGFGPLTVLLCDQCEKEYHVGCLKEFKMAELKKLPKGKWFCSVNCQEVFSALQNLLTAGAEKLPDSSLDVIKKKHIEKSIFADTDFDVKWRLLSGKIISRETRVLLSQAVAIFHDSFAPIVDCETGLDLIPSMVYGRNTRDQDFSGMYCAILTVNSTIVSAGILRVFGQEIAELPLAATRSGNQGKGYFQMLYSCIEKLLAFLNVKRFVLPATDAATSIWTDKFGFKRIPQEHLLDYRKNYWQMMTFKGTSILEKPVPKCIITNHHGEDSNVP